MDRATRDWVLQPKACVEGGRPFARSAKRSRRNDAKINTWKKNKGSPTGDRGLKSIVIIRSKVSDGTARSVPVNGAVNADVRVMPAKTQCNQRDERKTAQKRPTGIDTRLRYRYSRPLHAVCEQLVRKSKYRMGNRSSPRYRSVRAVFLNWGPLNPRELHGS